MDLQGHGHATARHGHGHGRPCRDTGGLQGQARVEAKRYGGRVPSSAPQRPEGQGPAPSSEGRGEGPSFLFAGYLAESECKVFTTPRPGPGPGLPCPAWPCPDLPCPLPPPLPSFWYIETGPYGAMMYPTSVRPSEISITCGVRLNPRGWGSSSL